MAEQARSREYAVAPGQGIDDVGKVENRGIDHIPDIERHSNPKNMAAAFVAVQFSFVIVIFGSFPITWGLGWWATMGAVTVGLLVGSLLIAWTSLSGPLTGTNQSVTSGAFFGVQGRLIGSAISILIDVGFLAIIAWTTGQAFIDGFHRLFGTPMGNGSLSIGMAIACLAVIVIGYLGHATLVASYWLWLVIAVVFQIVMIAVYAPHFHVLPGGHYLLGTFWPTWFLTVTLSCSIPVGYATWPNDYGRYMPRDTRPLTLGLWAGLSMFVGCWVALMLGAFLTSSYANVNVAFVTGAFARSPFWFVVPLMLYGFLGNVVNGGPGVYNSALDLQALLFFMRRAAVALIIGVIVFAVAYLGVITFNAINTIDSFVVIMIVIITSWMVITILGTWLRHGFFYTDALHSFAIPGARGPYWFTWGINFRAATAMAAGIVVGLMFATTTIFSGPFSSSLGGVDLSFISAGCTAGIVYLLLLAIFPEHGVLPERTEQVGGLEADVST
jgi:purine-cytosine permease-like protein